jgi:hypothetical protein
MHALRHRAYAERCQRTKPRLGNQEFAPRGAAEEATET